jgi:hypothetical protein
MHGNVRLSDIHSQTQPGLPAGCLKPTLTIQLRASVAALERTREETQSQSASAHASWSVELRKAVGYTQTELANELGVSRRSNTDKRNLLGVRGD